MTFMGHSSPGDVARSRSAKVIGLILLLPAIPAVVWAGAWIFRSLQLLGRDWGL